MKIILSILALILVIIALMVQLNNTAYSNPVVALLWFALTLKSIEIIIQKEKS